MSVEITLGMDRRSIIKDNKIRMIDELAINQPQTNQHTFSKTIVLASGLTGAGTALVEADIVEWWC